MLAVTLALVPAPFWEQQGCTHGHGYKPATRGVDTVMRSVQPLTRQRGRRAWHFQRCTLTRLQSRRVRQRLLRLRAWRRSYPVKWRMRFRRLPGYGQAWARSTAQCESTMNQRAYNPAGPWYSYLQWSLSTWYAAGGDRHPYAATFEHQGVLGWHWHLSYPSGQWPVCGE